MTHRNLLLATVFMYGGGLALYGLQQAGLIPADNPADLAPLPASSLTPAASGFTSSDQITVIDATTGELRVGELPVDGWMYRRHG